MLLPASKRLLHSYINQVSVLFLDFLPLRFSELLALRTKMNSKMYHPQEDFLIARFRKNPDLDEEQLKELATTLKIRLELVKEWFSRYQHMKDAHEDFDLEPAARCMGPSIEQESVLESRFIKNDKMDEDQSALNKLKGPRNERLPSGHENSGIAASEALMRVRKISISVLATTHSRPALQLVSLSRQRALK